MMKYIFGIGGISFFIAACSPLKSSSRDEPHQIELTVHEVRTGIDDIRHDLHCLQAQMQLIDDKIKEQENELYSVKRQNTESGQNKIDVLIKQIAVLEGKLAILEKKHIASIASIEEFSGKANIALSQHKDQLHDIEKLVAVHEKKMEGAGVFRKNDVVAGSPKEEKKYFSYKVKSGDSLERIAKINKTSVEEIKKANHMDNDFIVVGQSLKVPLINER
jgi:LysM repeat protein